MKLHACRHCGSRLRTYTELQEHLKTHPNVCVSCYRVFSNRSILLAHTCKVEEYLCEICQRSYSTQTKLHNNRVVCVNCPVSRCPGVPGTPFPYLVINKRVVGTSGHRDTGTPGYSHTPPDCYVTNKRVVGTS